MGQVMKKKSHKGEVKACGATDRGRVRDHNEDNYYIDEELKLFIVADGVGGHQGGKKASEIVVTILPLLLNEALAGGAGEAARDALESSVRALNRKVFEKSQEIDELRGMGSTLVSCFIRNEKAYIANMGDSRGYLLRDRKIQKVTEDHSMVQSMVRMGQIDARQAEKHPLRHVITRYVGMEGNFGADITEVDLMEGDRILLCSDGLTDMLPERAIVKLASDDGDSRSLCQTLVDKANDAGGRDNVTVLVVQIGDRAMEKAKPHKHVRSVSRGAHDAIDKKN
jgi:PPM family protein phosphatase